MFLKLTDANTMQPVLIRADRVLTAHRTDTGKNIVRVEIDRHGIQTYEVNETADLIQNQIWMATGAKGGAAGPAFLELHQLDSGLPVVVNVNELVLFRMSDNRPGSGCFVLVKANPGNDRIAVSETAREILGMISAARAGGAA